MSGVWAITNSNDEVFAIYSNRELALQDKVTLQARHPEMELFIENWYVNNTTVFDRFTNN